MKVKRDNDNGDSEVFEDRMQVDQVIARYFEPIHKRPDQDLATSITQDDKIVDKSIITTATFSLDDIR